MKQNTKGLKKGKAKVVSVSRATTPDSPVEEVHAYSLLCNHVPKTLVLLHHSQHEDPQGSTKSIIFLFVYFVIHCFELNSPEAHIQDPED